jgi:hypothetical protein
MGFRYRRSFRVLPGVRVNIGKTGVTSVSVGRRGLTTNFNAKGSRTTFGIPSTGLSYSTDRTGGPRSGGRSSSAGGGVAVVVFVVVAIVVVVLR